jgi:hypothetical protein
MLRKTGVPIIALRYEDLLDRPGATIQQLLDWCDLTETRLESVLEVMKRDAQSGSPLARDRVRHWPMDQCHKKSVSAVLNRHPSVRSPQVILPGTIGSNIEVNGSD